MPPLPPPGECFFCGVVSVDGFCYNARLHSCSDFGFFLLGVGILA